MRVQDRMKRLVEETPDVRLVAFCDVSSGLILDWAARSACPREVLDQMGEKAAACLAMLARHRPQAGHGLFGSAAIQFNESGARIFARTDAQSEDVICVECDPGAPLEARLQAARGLAGKVAVPE